MAASVPCPICGKKVPLKDPNSPFCSDRCRMIDLGNWASDKYVIPGPSTAGENDVPDVNEDSEDVIR